MITTEQAGSIMGRTMVGQDGDRIGKVGQVFLDDETGKPEWATVSTGLFGTRESFVPLAQAQLGDDSLQVPYTQDVVKDAPSVDADASLSQEEEAALYSYYGLGYSERSSDSGLPTGTTGTTTGTTGTAMQSASGGGDAMTRSQEQLRVGTERVETGRARLRKFVVTERQTEQVQVAHDEVRVVREPITDANSSAAHAGPEITEAEHEVVLTAERPVVEKEVVPVERIRMETATVTDTETVSADVRSEQVEALDAEGRRTDVDSDPTR